MSRVLTLVALLAVSLAAAPAASAKGKAVKRKPVHGVVLSAVLAPVQQDVADYAGHAGRTWLVVSRRRAVVGVKLTDMVPGDTYGWDLVAGGCDGTSVDRFTYQRLKAQPSGVAAALAWAGRGEFAFNGAGAYSVVVHAPGTDQVLLCGELKNWSRLSYWPPKPVKSVKDAAKRGKGAKAGKPVKAGKRAKRGKRAEAGRGARTGARRG